jgi:hypothetical protein
MNVDDEANVQPPRSWEKVISNLDLQANNVLVILILVTNRNYKLLLHYEIIYSIT